jgi:hypothetical protein
VIVIVVFCLLFAFLCLCVCVCFLFCGGFGSVVHERPHSLVSLAGFAWEGGGARKRKKD